MMAASRCRRKERWVDRQERRRWWKRVLWLGGILVALLVVLVLIRIGYAQPWTGFGQANVHGDKRCAEMPQLLGSAHIA
jgi:hypothetical protein